MPSALFIKVILSSLLCPHPNRVSLPHSSILLVIIRIHDGEGNSNPLQYSCLENPMDKGAWYTAIHGVAKSRTQLRDFIFTFHFHALEKEMATHSSTLVWRTPGTEEPGWLLSMGSHRVRHDWSDLAAAAAAAATPFLSVTEQSTQPFYLKGDNLEEYFLS